MPDAIANTSPLLYLYRVGVMEWLPRLFGGIWVPAAVVDELRQGRQRGYDVPDPSSCGWLKIVSPRTVPLEWLALDLGPGELATMALALENPARIVLLDDRLARRTAQAAGLAVWGTLRVLLEAKKEGLTERIEPLIHRLRNANMWLSDEIQQRILALAGEK